MNRNIWGFLLIACFSLTACGGGSDEPKANDSVIVNPPPVVTPPAANTKVNLQITSSDIQLNGARGDALPITITGNWQATDLGTNSVFVRAFDENKNIITNSTQNATSTNSFSLQITTNPKLLEGNYNSSISVVACKDLNCKNLYENALQTLKIQLSLTSVPEWQTHQGNAAHNGYVPIWVATNNFKKIWEWKRPITTESLKGINSPAAGKGHVYISTDVFFNDAAVIALDELTGNEVWRLSFGSMPALNAPAINQDSLFIATSGHQDTKVWAIKRTDGKLKFQSSFSSQWSNYLAPTVDENLIFQTGGYFGGELTAFSTVDGSKVWNKSAATSWGRDTATIDQNYVYTHDGSKLSMFNKQDGALITSISDPFGSSTNYEYNAAPVIGSNSNILAYSGGTLGGSVGANSEYVVARVISSFDIAKKQYNWSTQSSYKTFFAVANGVIYATKNSPVALDAIDENTGKVLWSWTAPSNLDTSFHRNVVVTNNLLFFSTNANLYAIDITSKKVVWSYPEPGMISISDNRILFLATGASESDGRLIAFDIRSK